ncbi:MAG: adenylyltransferase/cytidyltransferase family protein [Patescibacteria group bacterium]|nr:adenylyltransferase/cytidyltransferase family protein [Patescibacteria group bacterium]
MKRKMVIAVSGYFNPFHVGHLEMIEKARALGDYLVVILNNDNQVRMKGSVPFMSEADRMKIIGALRDVDEVFLSIDTDKTICESLRQVKPDVFANGGDRHQDEVPEAIVCKELSIKMVDELGGKIRSSSHIICQAKKYKDKRDKEK